MHDVMPETQLRSVTFLNMRGDVTVTWEKKDDEHVKALIQKLMDAGVTFFHVKGRIRKETVQLKTLAELGNKKSVIVQNEDVQKLAQDGRIKFAEVSGGTIKAGRAAKTADEVAASTTVATAAKGGG